MPASATPTPGVLNVWLSPILPEELKNPIEEVSTISGRPVEFVSESDAAHIRVEENAAVTKSNWIFALVAPFPTTMDSVSYEDIRSVWAGVNDPVFTLLASTDSAAKVEIALGEVSEANVTILDERQMLEVAWEAQNSFAIIPFDALEPRWKVIDIDGVSPIDKEFISDVYPLSISFGMSGESGIVDTFLNTVSWPVSNRDPKKLTIVAMTGVTALTRATAWTMQNKGIEYPAEKIGQWLSEADITHISNEVSFLETCPPPKPDREGLKFCSDPEYIKLLEVIGTDVIELTGNHIKDYGDASLLYSLELYRELGWQYYGGGEDLEDSRRPAIFEHNGNRIAFIGCNYAGPPGVWAKDATPGALPCADEQLLGLVNALRSAGILPVFTFQWSEYYQAKPSTKQKQDFQAAIDAGALIVSGSQAHQPQAFEFYEDGLIHYGLGNLFFDQMWSIATRQEFIDRHVFYDGNYISTEVLTVFLEDFAQPRPMTEEERGLFLRAIFTASGW
jgi:poly-gamma-glutamate synthesis protein (capsule biosynthesis protein)